MSHFTDDAGKVAVSDIQSIAIDLLGLCPEAKESLPCLTKAFKQVIHHVQLLCQPCGKVTEVLQYKY